MKNHATVEYRDMLHKNLAGALSEMVLKIRTELEGLSAFRNPMLRRFSKTTSR